jgi:hypothetical protein
MEEQRALATGAFGVKGPLFICPNCGWQGDGPLIVYGLFYRIQGIECPKCFKKELISYMSSAEYAMWLHFMEDSERIKRNHD